MEALPVDVEMVAALRDAARQCDDRGLLVASKWAAELLLSIAPAKRQAGLGPSTTTFIPTKTEERQLEDPPMPISPHPSPPADITAGNSLPLDKHPHAPTLRPLSEELIEREKQLQALEADDLMACKAFMDNKQYIRAVPRLRNAKSAKAVFMKAYSQFIVSEKNSMTNWYKLDGSREQQPNPLNRVSTVLLKNISATIADTRDPWLLFLREEAIESTLLSIATYPWNWSAWTVLGECVYDGEELSSILPLLPLPPSHPLVQMFQIKTLNSLNSPSENELVLCDRLLHEDMFPKSTWIMSLRACVLYHLHGTYFSPLLGALNAHVCTDFGQAEAQFKKILTIEDCRVDDIDVYSNILYVTENRLELSRLAHELLVLDKDRPEVCCLVGNHYSLRSQHDKAIKYFKRATQLDRTYLSAWTLMGHEYVEMKNAHAAIEAYRKAVDVNRKDYRAWYGLGQAYELLSMHDYALYYYQHATSLRPYDVRIWQAQGMCYQEMGRYREALECLKRALIGADPFETAIRLRMAGIYKILEELSEEAVCHNYIVETYAANNRPINEYAGSCVEVAKYHVAHGGDLELAKVYMERVAASNSEYVAQATELLKKIKSAIAEKKGVVGDGSGAASGMGASAATTASGGAPAG
ncbi:hypothetical protein BC835DRAFT_1412536 [Cytidiella melzeri]|nr:hypothetical protein BC835DRAFT_1412536 [Cytidiella melzeri]